MRAICKPLLPFWLGVLACLPLRAADCELTLPVADAGWYNAAGAHDPENNNYIVGFHAPGATELRNFFLFNIPPLTRAPGAAVLRLYTFTVNSVDGAETLQLREVTTPVNTLTSGAGAGIEGVFTDLADGTNFGSRGISQTEANTFISIPLNAQALAAIYAAAGESWALGGSISTLSPTPSGDEKLFAFSSGTADYVELVLRFAPEIVQQPPSIVTALTGQSVNFQVTACGAPPLQYRWFFNGAPMANRTNNILSLNSVTSAAQGEYFAVVSNALGMATSTVTRLYIDVSAPSIVAPVNPVVVTVGETINLFANASGIPAPSMQWRFNGQDIPGATNNSYSIPNAQIYHTATFSFVASNFFGAVTSSAPVTVQPLYLFGPGDQTIARGLNAYISAGFSSPVPVTFQWQRHGTNLPGATANVLSIFAASDADAGEYAIIASNQHGSVTNCFTISLVNQPPLYAWIGTRAQPGEPAILEGNYNASEPTWLQWQVDGIALTGETNRFLVLDDWMDASPSYSIVVSNAFGAVTSNPVALSVSEAAPYVYGIYAPVAAFAGDLLALHSHIFAGWRREQFSWRFNGELIAGATNASLVLTNVTAQQTGVYRLEASNALGSSYAEMFVSIEPRRALDRWQWRNPVSQANDLEHVAFTQGRLVAAGEGGSIVTSTNGMDWEVTALGNQYAVISAAGGNGRFVLLVRPRYSFAAVVLVGDGTNWSPRPLPIYQPEQVSFLNGEFWLSGFNQYGQPAVWRSPNAEVWSKDVTMAPAFLVGHAVGNGRHVAVAFNGIFWSSDNGRFWELENVPSLSQGVTFGNGLFVATDFYGLIWTSPNGKDWTARPVAGAQHFETHFEGITFGNGQFIAVGDNGVIARSTDGQNWGVVNTPTSKNLNDVLFTGSAFVAVGNDGVVLTSINGVNWTDHRQGRTKDWFGITYAQNQFVVVGNDGAIVTSPDGESWTNRASTTGLDLLAVAHGAGQFVAVGRSGSILNSPDCVSWTRRANAITNDFLCVAWGNGTFVATGYGGMTATSTNGLVWDFHSAPVPANAEMEGMTFGSGRFVAVGKYQVGNAESIVLVSTNGRDWQNPNVNIGKGLRAVAHGNGVFYAAANDGRYIYSASSNALAWHPAEVLPVFENWRSVTFAGGRMILMGNAGAIYSGLEDGFLPHASIVFQNFHAAAYGAGRLVAVGNAGTIVQSDFLLPRMSAPRKASNQLHFQVSGGVSEYYTLEVSDDLFQWQRGGSISIDGTTVEFTVPATNSKAFYRLTVPN